MIVATAGHVDHGKTSLVRALTGVECDQLPEERRRGMSIDLGFAHAGSDSARLGFVDVPGHERFVANLLAGVAGIDLALLVVAADDGPMAQTREHLTILCLLGIGRCIVALTKVDRVDAVRQAEAYREIQALLATGPLAGAPIFPVDTTTGDGVPALRQALDAVAADLPARSTAGAFRLAVDRSFVRDGAGRVVTGAVRSGRVRVGDRVVASPAGAEWRVRGIQTQGTAAEAAAAGERCALNLVGVGSKDAPPARGDWIVATAVHAPTDRLDVRLVVAPGASRALSPQGRGLQLHLGTACVGARVVVLGGAAIAAGATGGAQLVLDRSIAALFGDRFVLRDPAVGEVVAGGMVLDPFATARGRATAARGAQLAALSRPGAAEALAGWLAAGPDDGLPFDRFVLGRNLDPDAAEALGSSPGITRVDTAAGCRALATGRWAAWKTRVAAALAELHAAEPDRLGASESAIAAQLGSRGAASFLLRPALAALADDGTVTQTGFRWCLAAHRPVLSDSDAACLARVAAVLAPAGLRPPIVGELGLLLGMPLPALLDFLRRAERFGALVGVAPNRWFLPATVAELAHAARQLAAESTAGFDAAAYRDRTGIGRNLTVQVLEFLDREGATRFDGQRRRCMEIAPSGTGRREARGPHPG